MKYRIELAATAKADIREQGQWLYSEISPAASDTRLRGAIQDHRLFLQTRPLRCPVAAENDLFSEEIRELR